MAPAEIFEGIERLSLGTSADEPMLTEELLILGDYLCVAILQWQSWIHRKVESVELLPGSRGRRRISIDCTPPNIVVETMPSLGSTPQ